MKKQLFISKNSNELDSLINFCTNKDIEVIAHSFLQFEAIPFQVEEPYEAIFFSSPRAVDFFLSQEIIPANTILGCIGEITAQALKKFGVESNFIGKNAGDPTLIAHEFNSFVGNKKVLFPQSNISNRSISSVFDSRQIKEISIYKTGIHSFKIHKSDVYVFTSPSNVDGFLEENQINESSKIIAWGKTTEKHLINKGFQVDNCLLNSTIEELVILLKSIPF